MQKAFTAPQGSNPCLPLISLYFKAVNFISHA